MSWTADDGDIGELADLFRQHSADLFRHACFLVQGDSDAADDLVQDVFHAAAVAWSDFRSYGEERRTRWLFRVLRNKWVDDIRARSRRPLAALPDHDWPAPDETARQALCAVTLSKCWAVVWQMPQSSIVSLYCTGPHPGRTPRSLRT